MTLVLCLFCDAMVPLPGPGVYNGSNWPKCARCSALIEAGNKFGKVYTAASARNPTSDTCKHCGRALADPWGFVGHKLCLAVAAAASDVERIERDVQHALRRLDAAKERLKQARAALAADVASAVTGSET